MIVDNLLENGSCPIKCEINFTSSGETDKDGFRRCHVSKCFFEYPFRLMLPKYASSKKCQWVYPVNFGGGLVGGDELSVQSHVGYKCCVLWTSQSFQKVFNSGGRGPCIQNLEFILENGSFLAILPDPIVCYKDAVFQQKQVIRMEKEANLILLDWFTAGRMARGENWSFESLQSTLSVFGVDDLILRESLDLSNTPFLKIKDTMGDYQIVGTCVLLGPFLENACHEIVEKLNKRNFDGQKKAKDLILTASPIIPCDLNQNNSKGCVIRIAATTTAIAYENMASLLEVFFPLFGGNPFENKF